MVLCGFLAAGITSGAAAEARFGDSTWVAPGAPNDSAVTTAGPRVAARDHERRWETALRTPFRVAFAPLRLVAVGLEAGVGYAGPRLFEPKPSRPPKRGPVLAPSVTVGALNDIGAGPVLTWTGFPSADAKLRLAGTWSTVDRRRVLVSEVVGDGHPAGLRLRAEYDNQPNRRFYGIGNLTPETAGSYFLLASTDADATLLLGSSIFRQVRIGGGFSEMSMRRGSHGTPLLEDVYAPGSAPMRHPATRELWYGVAADLAALDDGRDPSRGVHGRADLRRVSGRNPGDPDFDQWRLEGRAYVPVFAKRRVIAVRGVYAGMEPRGGDATSIPFYRLAESEDGFRFAGYPSGRFRDRQLALARVEYRWEIVYRMSALGLYELGEVAPRAGAFRLGDAHASYGGGLRLGLNERAALRFEIAKSVEGLQVNLSLGSEF